MSAPINRQVWLTSRPNGIPRAEDFAIREAEVPTIAEGQFLVRNSFVSVDPAMRGWIADKSTYWPRIEVGDTMRAYSVGEVIESRNPKYVPGDKVMGIFGWQDYAAVDEPAVYYKIPDASLPLSLWLGVLGLNGLTGYFGMIEVCKPKAVETTMVSPALGLTGGPEKVRQCLEEFGYDAAIDYKSVPDMDEALREACPDGIDAYFDCTSGAIHDAVMRQINLHARIAICGTAAYASWDPWNEGPRPERHLLVKRAIMQGFLTPDFEDKYDQALTDLMGWIRDGSLAYREELLEGIEAAPGSIQTLYSGANDGKLVIRL